MNYETVNPDLPSLKYGKIMEPKARNEYERISRQRGHKDLQVTECGFFVHPERVYIGASPDALVECLCCLKGLLEIKCPRSIATEQPSPDNMDALSSETGRLKKTHMYFFQCQAQMGVTGRNWCDFFVFTSGGHHLERLYFDESCWNSSLIEAEQFFVRFIAPELVHKQLKQQVEGSFSATEKPAITITNVVPPSPAPSPSAPCADVSPAPPSTVSGKRKQKTKNVAKRKVKCKVQCQVSESKRQRMLPRVRGSKPVYLCGHCNKECLEESFNWWLGTFQHWVWYM